MKLVKTEDAVGQVLCHDITQIIKGVTKDAVFRKGHVVKEEDIPVLLSVGKEHLYIWEKEEGMLHENETKRINIYSWVYVLCPFHFIDAECEHSSCKSGEARRSFACCCEHLSKTNY